MSIIGYIVFFIILLDYYDFDHFTLKALELQQAGISALIFRQDITSRSFLSMTTSRSLTSQVFKMSNSASANIFRV
jgi:hypothetical protein